MTQRGIMLLSPYDLSVPGGVQGQVIAMAEELARRGRRVVVAAPGQGSVPALAGAGVEEVRRGRVRRFTANGSVAPISLSISASQAVRRRAEDERFIVHLHEPATPVFGWQLLASSELGLVATFHRSGVDSLYSLAGPLLSRRCRHLGASAAVSEAAAATAHSALGVSPEILFNGLNLDDIDTATPWTTNGPTVLFIGRDEPRKGRAVLLEAAAHLEPTVTIWLTGGAPRGWAQGPGARLEWLGIISEAEKNARLRGADVLCAPSLGGESFGIVLLEGLAGGAAVVASDIDGYRQALSGHGVLFEPGNSSALAAALAAALRGGGPDKAAGQAQALGGAMRSLVDSYEALYERAELGH